MSPHISGLNRLLWCWQQSIIAEKQQSCLVVFSANLKAEITFLIGPSNIQVSGIIIPKYKEWVVKSHPIYSDRNRLEWLFWGSPPRRLPINLLPTHAQTHTPSQLPIPVDRQVLRDAACHGAGAEPPENQFFVLRSTPSWLQCVLQNDGASPSNRHLCFTLRQSVVTAGPRMQIPHGECCERKHHALFMFRRPARPVHAAADNSRLSVRADPARQNWIF